jgi:hypothetical protein
VTLNYTDYWISDAPSPHIANLLRRKTVKQTPYIYQLNKTCYLISDGKAPTLNGDELIRISLSARHESRCSLEGYEVSPDTERPGTLWRKVNAAN